MKLEDIMNFLEKKYNPELAEKWDNSGLIIGRKGSNVSAVIICLDITDDVIEQAIAARAELIISHHPLIFSEIKRITNDTNILNMDEIKIGAEIVFNITGSHNIGYAKWERYIGTVLSKDYR